MREYNGSTGSGVNRFVFLRLLSTVCTVLHLAEANTQLFIQLQEAITAPLQMCVSAHKCICPSRVAGVCACPSPSLCVIHGCHLSTQLVIDGLHFSSSVISVIAAADVQTLKKSNSAVRKE